MLDSVYHMTLKLLKNHIFLKDFVIFYPALQWTSLRNVTESVNH